MSGKLARFVYLMEHIFRLSRREDVLFALLIVAAFSQTSRAEFDDSAYTVRRRYNDFLWLRDRLTDAYPTHIVPVGGAGWWGLSFSSYLSHSSD